MQQSVLLDQLIAPEVLGTPEARSGVEDCQRKVDVEEMRRDAMF